MIRLPHPFPTNPLFPMTRMNRILPASVFASAVAATLSGCSAGRETSVTTVPPPGPGRSGAPSSPSAPAPAADASHREREIRVVMEMRERGEINDAQALRLIAALNGVTVPRAPAPAAVPVAESPPVAPSGVAPSPAPVVAAFKDSGYKAGARLTGRLRSVGSDSMDRVMERWTKGFGAHHEGLRSSHEGKGSSTAVPALLEGRADFGPMSRPLKAEELARFESRFGYAPTQIRTAVDALAVYVHPANPLAAKGLTLKQLDAVFSASRKRGGAAVLTWGDLGASGEWKAAPVRLYSRNSASGTFAFFKDEVLLKGEFRDDMKQLVGSAEVVSAVAADKFGIGYSGIGYKTSAVAALPLAPDEKSAAVEPGEAGAVSGAYPIARGLHVVINRKPGEAASDLQREFIAYVLGAEGQAAVEAEGYFALPPRERAGELAKLRYNAE